MNFFWKIRCNTPACPCPDKPDNSVWKSGHGTPPNCEWSCNQNYTKVGNSCKGIWTVTQPTSCPKVSCGYLGETKYGSVSCSTGNENDCDQSTKPTTPSIKCGATAPCCSGGRTWNGSSCVCPAGKTWNSALNQCEEAVEDCPDLPDDNARWLTGHGREQPNCSWTCKSGFVKSGNGCVPKKTYRCEAGDWRKISDSCIVSGNCASYLHFYHSDTCCYSNTPTASCSACAVSGDC